MKDNQKILAIVPARGGSKGLPRKNILNLQGHPLIAWTVMQAKDSKYVDRVIVSTDCPQIEKVSIAYGAEVPFHRPELLADDFASTEAVLIHAIDWLMLNENYIPDIIVLLQCTSPIRLAGTIDKAIDHMFNTKADSLLSVSEFHGFVWFDKLKPKADYAIFKRPRRQDISEAEKKYKENGSIYIFKNSVLKKYQNRLGGKISLYEMSELESHEIDTLADFEYIDWLIKQKRFTC